MTEKWNNKALFRLVWPLVIEQFLAVTMGAADTVMVSSVGEFAVSAVSIIDNINNLFIIAFTALSTGGAVVVSQYIGKQDSKNASLAAKQLVYIVTISSIIIAIIAVVFRRPVVRIIYGNLEDNVMSNAMKYFLITALSYPLLALYNACAALFRSMGNSKVPMKIALMVNIMHIVGNAFFLFVMHFGVGWVAVSTLLSRLAAAAILLVMLVKNRRYIVSLAEIQRVKLNPSMIRRILNIGIPTGLENSMFQFGRLLTQRIFPMFGTSIIAANAVASVINSFSFMTGNAFCIALLTVVGQCIGAGDYDAGKKFTVKLIKLTWINLFVISGLIYIFRDNLASLFSLSPEAHDAANVFLSIHCISMAIGWTLSFALPNALRAAGDAKYVMVIGIVSMWVVRVCFAYFFTFVLKFGPAGVWLAMGGDFIARSIAFTLRWKGGRWERMKVL